MANINSVILLSVMVYLYTGEASYTNKQRPIVTLSSGKVQGTVEKIYEGSSYFSFKGIPYAEAPVGQHRFQAPLPIKPWNGIRNAAEHGPVCMQFDILNAKKPIGSEQCLFLNVYSKSLDPTSKIPVMVFIHGGSFDFGSGNTDLYTPDLLLEHNVILVTINYRLELLGYLALDTREVPGNAGMRDQVMALKWINENIAKFGGDPDNITIFGESAGGSAVTYLVLSPLAKGLFHKAIAQSGVCLQDWAQGRDMVNRAIRAAKVLGKDTNNVEELLQFFRSLPADNLTNLNNKSMTPDEKKRDLANRFVPVVEERFPDLEPFIDEDPALMLLQKKANSVPLLLGYNSGEGLTIIATDIEKLDVRNKDPSYFVPSNIAERLSEEKTKVIGARIKKFYAGNENFTESRPEFIRDFGTDAYFAYNIHRFAYFYNKIQSPVYMYKFNYDTQLNIGKQFPPKYKHLDGATHSDDLFYIFYNELNKEVYDSHPTLRQYAYQITKLWTNFAKTGNPTPDVSLTKTKWRPYTEARKDYFLIQQNYTMGSYADRDRMEFWNEIYKEAGLPYIGQSLPK